MLVLSSSRFDPQQSLPGPGRCGWKADISLAAHRVEWLKAAKDKALGIERNFTRDLQTLVLAHFCFGGIEGRLAGYAVGHRSKRFDELDHSTTLIRIGQWAAHRAGIIRHVAGIAGPRDHRGHTRVAEQIFQEKLPPGAREHPRPVRQFLAVHCLE